MKATLEYDLSEEEEEFKLALTAGQLSSVLFNLSNYLRTNIKYSQHPDKVLEAYEDIRAHLFQLAGDAGVEV